MNFLKKALCAAMPLIMILSMSCLCLAAPVYKDVPSTHWAHEYISRMADRGLIVGDMEGNFKPNDSIDKFETSKILAKMAGYRYTNVSAAEQDYYNKAYDKNKSVLSQYSSTFTRWNSSADREIAYLLEKEILTIEDLNQFVIKRTDGAEALRALSREEAAVFLTKLMGRKNEALRFNDASRFSDDASINLASKQYVYYLRSLGVVSGDTSNNFNPNGAVTKAAMAVMCDKVLVIMEASSDPSAPPATVNVNNVNRVETISGTIDRYYDTLHALQIIASDGKKNIYKLSSSASITIDGFLKTASDLQEGMPAIMVISNNELMDLKAQSVQVSNAAIEPVSNPEPISNPELSTIEGTISGVSSDSTSRTISIELRMLNPLGQVMSETRTYTLTEECAITRGQASLAFSGIIKGDIVSARVSGSRVYNIKLEEKDKEILGGTLIEKNFIDATNSVILTIQDKNENIYDFKVTSDSYITRKQLGTCTWNELRIGDMVDVYSEYDRILELNASGVRSVVDVWVEEIHISRNDSYIVAKDMDNRVDVYNLISGTVDAYSLRIGSKVRLRLDSREVETVNILQDAEANSITGHIQSVRTSYIVVKDSSVASGRSIEIRYDENTVFVDSYTGNRISVRNLEVDSKVYVVLSSSNSLYAKTVTILTK